MTIREFLDLHPMIENFIGIVVVMVGFAILMLGACYFADYMERNNDEDD